MGRNVLSMGEESQCKNFQCATCWVGQAGHTISYICRQWWQREGEEMQQCARSLCAKPINGALRLCPRQPAFACAYVV